VLLELEQSTEWDYLVPGSKLQLIKRMDHSAKEKLRQWCAISGCVWLNEKGDNEEEDLSFEVTKEA